MNRNEFYPHLTANADIHCLELRRLTSSQVHANLPDMHAVTYDDPMEGRTIQVRGVDPEVAAALERTAAEQGITLSAYLRDQLAHLVATERDVDEWWRSLPSPIPVPALTQQEIDSWKAERDRRPEWH